MLAVNPSTPASPADTADLVHAAAGGDAAAWATLVERHTRTVNRVARGYRLSDADAADVAQTVWLRLLQHIGRLRHPERIGGWVATTARHECLRLCREHGRVRLVDDDAVLEAMGAEPDPAPPAESADRDAVLRSAVSALPPRQRVILDLLMADPPIRYGDIASGLNIPIGSIGPTRQRSLRSLRSRCVLADVRPG
ncbi:MAG: sigma-70 family RNA polymerase sigma factor [Actinomycetota bacterium]|nr:sigma-70 family RNA polymerase sigma factor [Actinomycetota bacterium]